MISKFNDIKKLFKELDKELNQKVEIYIIGGAVMLYHGLKIGTKDIDLIVDSANEFNYVKKALFKINFEAKIPGIEYKKFNLNQIFVRVDYRIDLFQKTVCNGFILSNEMKKRAKKIKELENLKVFLCSITDIFMFKTFTEREGDIDDCILLAKKGINWNEMLLEIRYQIKTSGQKVWVTYIGERLDFLVEKGLIIPIIKPIDRLREEYYDFLEKKLNKWDYNKKYNITGKIKHPIAWFLPTPLSGAINPIAVEVNKTINPIQPLSIKHIIKINNIIEITSNL